MKALADNKREKEKTGFVCCCGGLLFWLLLLLLLAHKQNNFEDAVCCLGFLKSSLRIISEAEDLAWKRRCKFKATTYLFNLPVRGSRERKTFPLRRGNNA